MYMLITNHKWSSVLAEDDFVYLLEVQEKRKRSGANYADKACRERENSLFTI